jgi:hypothetical protein
MKKLYPTSLHHPAALVLGCDIYLATLFLACVEIIVVMEAKLTGIMDAMMRTTKYSRVTHLPGVNVLEECFQHQE